MCSFALNCVFVLFLFPPIFTVLSSCSLGFFLPNTSTKYSLAVKNKGRERVISEKWHVNHEHFYKSAFPEEIS